MTDDSEDRLQLAALVTELRREILTAQSELQPGDATFRVQTIELEAAVEIQKIRGGSGGVKFYVIEVGATGSNATSSAHRIKLTLTPTRETAINRTGRRQ